MAVYQKGGGLSVDNVTLKANTSGQAYVNVDANTIINTGSNIAVSVDAPLTATSGVGLAINSPSLIVDSSSELNGLVGDLIFA